MPRGVSYTGRGLVHNPAAGLFVPPSRERERAMCPERSATDGK